MITLSKRLEKVANFIDQGNLMADIGSDHAYLPIYLIEHGKIERAIAGEVVEGPFKHAKLEVCKRKLEDQIEVRLGDGLEVIQTGEVLNYLSICGMGGALIKDIIDQGQEKIHEQTRLILQPNVGEDILRKFLSQQKFEIVDEEILLENGKYYEIIVCQRRHQHHPLTSQQILFGPKLLERPTGIFKGKWNKELQKLKKIVQGISSSNSNQVNRLREFEKKIQMIEEILNG